METAGYSGKPLWQKLGLKAGMRARVLNPPPNYQDLLEGAWPELDDADSGEGKLDFLHYFTQSFKELERDFPQLKSLLAQDGALWISWPKRTSGVTSDLNENIVRDIGLACGLVDVKVAAIDEIWSGLKFVYRLADRK